MTLQRPADWNAFCRRAGGRRQYNAVRRFRALERLTEVVNLLVEFGRGYGYQSQIADRLGVHRSTICRDIARLTRIHWGGRKADEEHRATIRLQRRIRAEDKAEMERAVQDQPASETLEDSPPPILPVQPPVPVPPTQLPRRLSSFGSDLGSRLRPEASRSRNRRGA